MCRTLRPPFKTPPTHPHQFFQKKKFVWGNSHAEFAPPGTKFRNSVSTPPPLFMFLPADVMSLVYPPLAPPKKKGGSPGGKKIHSSLVFPLCGRRTIFRRLRWLLGRGELRGEKRMLLILLPPDVILTIGACSLQQPPLPHPLLKNERRVEGWLRTERGKMKTSVPPWPYLGVWQSHET